MKVLVLNCGSSSVKYTFFDMDGEKRLAFGIVECIGLPEAYYKHQVAGEEEVKEACKVSNHVEAVDIILQNLINRDHGIIQDIHEISAVGHRIVHGGEKFSKSVLITDEVMQDIKNCFVLAPLHNPHNYVGIEACVKLLPGVPEIAVFDTAFHQTIPQFAHLYALPYSLYQKYNIRKYGFHGTSHKYVAQRAAEFLGKPLEELKLITCHLGNGCSITAINKGVSVETSMGFTPLEGLVMGTRCGDIDPYILIHLQNIEKISLDDLNTLLNKKSGLLGISGLTSDMRTILKAMSSGSEKAKLAIDVYCYRVKKYIASYLGVLNGADAVIFTAGVGENSPTIRERCCQELSGLGISVDSALNSNIATNERQISEASSKVKVLVIPTNEELMIARESSRVLTNN
ncbi:MAG TPA: acetate kinase [Elusimicrobia bacterium]|nr:MAG: acetate kinase [Elusimicrobia bacterium RIFOXYA12_FULL_49_49]OGS09936.1 MAG: acetate kinase [Elusimicrobia bacterium RIFOXYA1_FULL_47_7]OGS11270.1 MAG: acetate kinase [Elusimicrobia bacterium RIFOXYB1_FULL_48_9]OGS15983.1 MAG: acetate kinase [Elusimicrobia bacterium RIFOXYA2_FULL_47_53]OGS26337.1 MAG: acetate kinase [Elusimicrobia bacterium RIFOXYB12_FULL_50_12]OGS29151.1 MAG: acetate kinase [Elusimicrobia bacterium RIFOXYB2_FULL_46_23]HBU69378.1 acetate kinase [Elusimicrobiota bacter